MEKRDYKKTLKHLYKPSAKKPEIVEVPKMNFLMVDGKGDPNTAKSFQEAVECLFSISYTIKFMIKKGEAAIDYGVMPLEALWRADDMSAFTEGKKDDWRWTVMIMQPEVVVESTVEAAQKAAAEKKALAALPLVRFETFTEGRAAQVLHIGPFTDEGPTIERLHQFIADCGEVRTGDHHEIYLSDIRRAAPENWKTVIRQPMK